MSLRLNQVSNRLHQTLSGLQQLNHQGDYLQAPVQRALIALLLLRLDFFNLPFYFLSDIALLLHEESQAVAAICGDDDLADLRYVVSYVGELFLVGKTSTLLGVDHLEVTTQMTTPRVPDPA